MKKYLVTVALPAVSLDWAVSRRPSVTEEPRTRRRRAPSCSETRRRAWGRCGRAAVPGASRPPVAPRPHYHPRRTESAALCCHRKHHTRPPRTEDSVPRTCTRSSYVPTSPVVGWRTSSAGARLHLSIHTLPDR